MNADLPTIELDEIDVHLDLISSEGCHRQKHLPSATITYAGPRLLAAPEQSTKGGSE
jgi:hypothetical protein